MVLIFQDKRFDSKENLYNYHEVFATSLSVILDLIRTSRKQDAREIMIYNFIYANSLNGGNFSKERIEDFRKMDLYELLYIMVEEQKKADLTPTQNNIRNSYYSRIQSKIKEGLI